MGSTRKVAIETIAPTQRQYFALGASIVEGEQAAHDTIFEAFGAMVLNGATTRVIVYDLRLQ